MVTTIIIETSHSKPLIKTKTKTIDSLNIKQIWINEHKFQQSDMKKKV